ncbi:helix-turn-helix domain-containing protein [Halorientalis salina]|uniref:helix-turn-helix domain-containing protein n=1 Tax=Halorientalis salina TaxID=2932266 RepID=UPI00351D1E9D
MDRHQRQFEGACAADLAVDLAHDRIEAPERRDQVGEYDRGLQLSESLLTDRQQEAVRAAIDHGYYEVPRSGSVEDVAAALDCAPSTASNHLRKAEARLAEAVASVE